MGNKQTPYKQTVLLALGENHLLNRKGPHRSKHYRPRARFTGNEKDWSPWVLHRPALLSCNLAPQRSWTHGRNDIPRACLQGLQILIPQGVGDTHSPQAVPCVLAVEEGSTGGDQSLTLKDEYQFAWQESHARSVSSDQGLTLARQSDV